jgi:hypothetical protein
VQTLPYETLRAYKKIVQERQIESLPKEEPWDKVHQQAYKLSGQLEADKEKDAIRKIPRNGYGF